MMVKIKESVTLSKEKTCHVATVFEQLISKNYWMHLMDRAFQPHGSDQIHSSQAMGLELVFGVIFRIILLCQWRPCLYVQKLAPDTQFLREPSELAKHS